ncbi:MAG: 30S ribosomal protein S1 [Desulfovibrionaceae bacterium]
MADEMKSDTQKEESFEDLLASYEDGMNADLRTGDQVRGRVIAINVSNVFVDTGTKVDGVVERAELLDENGELTVKEGDEIELYVVSRTSGEIKLSRAMSGQGGLALLEQAKRDGLPVEGKVTGTCKGGFTVEIMHRRAFCPVSQIDDSFVEDTAAYVGNTYRFGIIKLEDRGRNLVVSRRDLLKREKAEAQDAYLAEVKPGDVVEARVSRLAKFGAFVELSPGVDGLVHISELGYARVEDPADVVAPGDAVTVKILEVGHDAKGRLKISLSMKQAMDDPWLGVADQFKVGESITGRVTRLAKFGAFVEMAPGVDGLVHISEMSYLKRVHKPEDVVAPGQEITAVIKEIDLGKRRISLSMKDAEGDPWADVAERFVPGQSYPGTVEKMEQFGLFITLAPGITGLMPKSLMAKSETAKELEKLTPGASVTVAVESVKPEERKVTLTPTDAREAENWKQYAAPAPKAEKPASGGMGLLADKLKAAIKAKNDK